MLSSWQPPQTLASAGGTINQHSAGANTFVTSIRPNCAGAAVFPLTGRFGTCASHHSAAVSPAPGGRRAPRFEEPMSSAPKSGRNIVAYFAGYLANLVNGGDTLDPIQD